MLHRSSLSALLEHPWACLEGRSLHDRRRQPLLDNHDRSVSSDNASGLVWLSHHAGVGTGLLSLVPSAWHGYRAGTTVAWVPIWEHWDRIFVFLVPALFAGAAFVDHYVWLLRFLFEWYFASLYGIWGKLARIFVRFVGWYRLWIVNIVVANCD